MSDDLHNIEQRLESAILSNQERFELLIMAAQKDFDFDPRQSLILGSKALNVANNEKDRATTYRIFGTAYLRLNQFDKANEYLSKSVKTFRTEDDASELAKTLLALGASYAHSSQYTKAKETFEEQISICKKINDPVGLGNGYLNYGYALHGLNKTEGAFQAYKKSIETLTPINYIRGLAFAHNNIASFYFERKDYPQALQNYFKALTYAQEDNNRYSQGDAYNNIGYIYKEIHLYHKALEFLNKSLTIREAIENEQGVVSTLLNIGNAYLVQGNYNSAEEYIQKGCKLAQTIENPQSILRSYLALRELHHVTKRYQEVFELLKTTLVYAQENQLLNYVSEIKAFLGIASYYINDFDSAEELLNQSIEALSKEEKYALLEEIYMVLSQIAIRRENYEQAFQYLSKSKDELKRHNDDTSRKILAGERIKYNVLEKNNKILKLEREKVAREYQYQSFIQHQKTKFIDSIISSQFETREVIAKKLHSEIGFLIVNAKRDLLALVEKNKADLLSSKIQKVIDNIEHLYQETRELSHTLNTDGFNLLASIQQLINTSNQGVKQPHISFHPHGDLEIISSNISMDIYQIIHEGILNCIKHAEATHMDIYLSIFSDRTLEVCLEDNGKGLPKEFTHNKGFNDFRSFAEKNDGTFDFSSSAEGVCLTFSIPC